MEKRTLGIIVTHGGLADELLRTVRMIVGEVHDCHAMSGSDLCSEEVTGGIRELLAGGSDLQAVVFVDFFGGSCSATCVRAVRDLERVKVISGVNLPMLLDFVTKQRRYGLEEIVAHLLQRGRESIRSVEF